MGDMRKILLFLIFFSLGILSVLRCQYYNREATPDSSFSEKLKNVVDGIIDDGTAFIDYVQKKTAKGGKDLSFGSDSDAVVTVENVEVDSEEPLAAKMNAEGV